MQVTGTAIRRTLSTSTLTGDKVVNRQGEDLGKIEDLMLDLNKGCVSYAVLSFGGFLGMGDKLFAVPWQSMALNEDTHEFVLDITRDRLENAPGFDKNRWPDFDSDAFQSQINDYYGYKPTTSSGGMGGGGMGGY